MGKKAEELRKRKERKIRSTPLNPEERKLLAQAVYEGSPFHKRNPGDFGLTPPAAPRADRTLCDEAGVFSRAVAGDLLKLAISRELVSEATAADGFPKQIWLVESGRVFEAMYGGSRRGRYHGYPIREGDPFAKRVFNVWRSRS